MQKWRETVSKATLRQLLFANEEYDSV